MKPDNPKNFTLFYRIYRSNARNSWDEISPKQFPRHLAVLNTQKTWQGLQGSLDYFLTSEK